MTAMTVDSVSVDSFPADSFPATRPALAAPEPSVPVRGDVAAPATSNGRYAGVATMFGSAVSSQVGAAVGSVAFPVIGPVGVVAVRQYVAALVLLAVGRPRLRSFTGAQWRPVVLLGARGQGKSHLLAALYHLFTNPTAGRQWLTDWSAQLSRPDIAALTLRTDCCASTEK